MTEVTQTIRPITGKVDFTIGGKTAKSKWTPHVATIDFDSLPEASRAFLLHYGIRQYLADGMAGATSQAEFDTGIKDRLTKIAEADFSRTRGEGLGKPDTDESRAIKLAKAAIRAKAKANNMTLTKEKVDETATKLIAADPKFLAEAKKQLAAEAKLRESADGSDDLLAAMLAEAGVTDASEAESEEKDEGESES
jgi:hypothetical protein